MIHKINNHNIEVISIDDINLKEVIFFDRIIFSPGPGVPEHNNIMEQILENYSMSKSILGICLGFQAIVHYFGAKLYNMENLFHGIQKEVFVKDSDDLVFLGIPNIFFAGFYHSWAVNSTSFPQELKITAKSADNIIVAFRHRNLDIYGFQFHPESYMTPSGKHLIENWLKK